MRFETAGLATVLRPVLRPALQRLPSALRKAELNIPRPDYALFIGLLLLAVYLAVLPFIARTWRATGDEPHYLLAAHSLVNDLDVDLTNNYAQFDYLNFYLSKDITPQIRLNAAGEQILNHHLGLPLLIAPAYALGGRFGVLLFQAILGALLAVVTFRLTCFISRDLKASLLATVVVVLSPPLLMYHYLIYPELAAALLVTAILYYVITQDEATPFAVLVVTISLIVLPWLNRRFIFLTIVLALLVLWSWRKSGKWTGGVTGPGVAGVAAAAISIGLLFWVNSQFDPLLRPDFAPPEDVVAIWNRLVRGVGWLVDQQRGLLIFAPVYILAVWGVPILVSAGLKERNRHWIILVPFAVSLAVVVGAGGFWIAWEVGPRFLVATLPALAPLLALAWRNYRHSRIFVAFALLLFAASLVNSWVIIKNPDMPYKSSLPLFYSGKLNLPLTEILPDLAEYTVLSPSEVDSSADGEPAWFAPAGNSQILIDSGRLGELPFGHYILTWRLATQAGLPPDAGLARVSTKYLGGGQLFNRLIIAADLPTDGSFGTIEHKFFNAKADRWHTPMILYASSTGQADLQASELWIKPDPFYAYLLPYLYLGILVFGAVITVKYTKPQMDIQKTNSLTPISENSLDYVTANDSEAVSKLAMVGIASSFLLVMTFLLLAVLAASVGYLVYQQAQPGQVYSATQLNHFTGHRITDPDTHSNQVWLVDPATDSPQKAIYGPFDFYDAGEYRVTYRLKLPKPVTSEQEIARLQVNATTNYNPLITQPILAEHFSKPNLYHDMVLTFNNPRRQAISFEVDYLGVAPLVIDTVTVTKLKN